jgi:hypothetical protein
MNTQVLASGAVDRLDGQARELPLHVIDEVRHAVDGKTM